MSFLLLWLVGCVVTILHIEVMPDTSMGQGFEPLAVARSLAAGQGFSNPYQVLPTGPTAHCAPLYPWLVAGGIRLFGNEVRLTIPLALFHVFLHGLQFALLPLVSLRLLGDRRPGYVAAGLLVVPLFPLAVQIETILQTVTILVCLLIPIAAWSAVPAALLGALSLHVNPSGILLLGGWLWWKRPPRRWVAIYSFTLVAACVPWTIRNYTTFGKIFFLRDNLPLELYVSNNDESQAYTFQNSSLLRYHPDFSLSEAQDVQQMGEAAYMADRGRRARAWITSHPQRFLQLSAARAWLYWFPRIIKRPWRGALLSIMTILSLPGMYLLRRHPVFVTVFMVYPLLYYFIQADSRYRQPFLWATLLAAGFAFCAAFNRWRGDGTAATAEASGYPLP
ncbi:hypothetical protein [Paludibaculum fermentans]|uniref:Glycosyltransferase RgtA/B/C/D-like domain-containing protein n=1 Tax=Paludibaculum fermentans TaxID=1473598 RepID=A0A7S7NKW6_PALFE|nr:hypothetical protein [Paludibaculum fermentans]QOY85497.1 hypothetical protein IRI77_22010 [Paludibaculum fermentans]